MITIQKTANVNGYCPFLDEEVTIKTTFTKYAPLGTEPLATPGIPQCAYVSGCQQDENCPVLNHTFLWNEI